MKNSIQHNIGFLRGGGEMGELLRNYNWEQSKLGSPENWPHSLQTTIGIILHAASPMFLFWGKELLCFYNDAYRPSLGENGKHPLIGKGGKEVWPEIWYFIGPLIEKVMTTGEAAWFENQKLPIYRNGKIEDVYWTFSYSPAYGDQNAIEGVFVTCLETTAQIIASHNLQVAQEKIEKQQEQLLAYFEQSPVAIAIMSKENLTFGLVNAFYAELVGRKPEELENKPLLEALPELKGQGFDELLNKVIETGQPFIANEVAVELKRGGELETIYVNLTYQPQLNTKGEISGVLMVATDVTQQVRSRKKVEESEARFRAMAEGTDILIGVGDESSNATYLNNAWTVMTGRPIEELLKFGWVDLVHPEDRERHVNIYLEAFKIRSPFTSDFRMLANDGEYRWLHSRSSVRLNSDGVFAGYVSSCVDITEQVETRKEIEEAVIKRTEELAQSNLRLKRSNEELEQFAYIASHDLQEPVRKISTFTQMLEYSIQDKSEKSKDYFSKIYNSTDRMTKLIRDVLAFSRIKEAPNTFEKVDLNKIVETLKIDFELQIDETQATIETFGLPIIDALSSQMTQLFGNLLSNSLKYHKDGVKPIIKISSSIAKLEKVAKRLVLGKNKTYYHIEFSDNGIGFDNDHVERIFRIFQRLHGKTEFEGTGIGLAICLRIVQNHQGHISAAVGENGGATFNILIPKN